MKQNFITIKNLSKTFKGKDFAFDILKNVNFNINKAESLAIVGESGIGKSTLLHILGTLDIPDSGAIFFENENVFLFDKVKLAEFRNKYIGFVFQFHHLLAEFTAAENIMMPCLMYGMKKEEAKQKAEALLVKVGLQDRRNHIAAELSGGEQQRVALARAIIMEPKILLADEPTGNLDEKNSAKIHDLLFQLNKELNMTMAIVTHNLELAGYMQKRVTIIDGKLVEIN